MNKRKRIMIFIGIFAGLAFLLTISLVIYKFAFDTKKVEVEVVAPKVTSTPVIQTAVPTATMEIISEVIDYDSIPGLTEGQIYSQKLSGEKSKNILFIGEDKVAGLYDTIGILNIDRQNKKAKIIMIPRDTYIQYNKKVVHYLEVAGKADNPGFYKINCAHNIGPIMKYKGKFKQYSISFLADVIKEIFDIEIDDYIKVNTEGFVEIVDLFGGVDIDVPYNMDYDDPFQNLSIHLKKGPQHLDGKQAEGFVRFRQGYDDKKVLKSYGDLERKRNQVTFIKAFINQHATLENITKIPGLIKTMNKNMKTSIGIDNVIITYTGLLKDVVIDKYKIESVMIKGKSEYRNGTSCYIID